MANVKEHQTSKRGKEAQGKQSNEACYKRSIANSELMEKFLRLQNGSSSVG